jgi:hypothetical protein
MHLRAHGQLRIRWDLYRLGVDRVILGLIFEPSGPVVALEVLQAEDAVI